MKKIISLISILGVVIGGYYLIIKEDSYPVTEMTSPPGELIEKEKVEVSPKEVKYTARFLTFNTDHLPEELTFTFNKNVWNLLQKETLYDLNYELRHKPDKEELVLNEISYSKTSLDEFRIDIEEMEKKSEYK